MEAKQLETTLQEADGLLKEGYYDQALEALSGLDEDSEAGGLIACMKGCAFLQLEQDEQAHLCFGAALDKGFVNKELYINLGIVKSRIGNYKQAEQMFRQAADLDPVDALPLNRIILLRLGRGDFAGAEAVMDELMRRNPELVDGYHHKADLLLGTSRAEEALQLLAGVENRFSANSLYVYDLCRALRRTGRAQEALSYLNEHAGAFREEADAVLLLKQQASLLVELERAEEAEPIWQKLYELYGDRQAGMALAAGALAGGDMEALGRIAGEMTAAGVEDDSHYMCLYYKALALRRQGDEAGAAEALRAAAEQFDLLERGAKSMRLRSLRAMIRLELGRYEEALADVDFLLALAHESGGGEKIAATAKKLEELGEIIRSRMNSFE